MPDTFRETLFYDLLRLGFRPPRLRFIGFHAEEQNKCTMWVRFHF